MQERPDKPRLTVLGAGDQSGGGQGVRASVTDGSAAITLGGLIAGGFLVEALKSVMTGDASGRRWFVVVALAGLALLLVGFALRNRARRRVRIGIVVKAIDGRRGVALAQQRDQQAERFSQSACTVTLKTEVNLSGDGGLDRELVELLADEALTGTATAGRLAPDAARVNLIPTMPLHVAFWFGARLGHTHAQEVVVHSIRQGHGTPAYFPATSLRMVESKAKPLTVGRLKAVDGGSPTKVALALDLQDRGDQFLAPVMAACRQHGIGYVLLLRSASRTLREDMRTFNAVVNQTCNVWRDARLPEGARMERHAIFLSGPVAIAVALGARLAAPERGMWTAFTFDSESRTYEPFPPLA